MKQFYAVLSKTLLTAFGILFLSQVHSQSSTTVGTNGECGTLVQNFNTGSGGHASPSIFGGTFDSAFYYNGTLGYWTEMDGGRTDFFLPNRVVSIISPPYANPSAPGIFDVGFWYQTSSATADRFQVRLVAISPGPGGTTITNIVASSGVRRFADFGSFTFKVDAGNPANSGDTGRVCIRLNDADIVNVNTFYRVEIHYLVSGTTYAAYDNLSIGPIVAPAPLPVNFIGVVAQRVDNGINVRWDVADETDVQEYHLEKSTNGFSFTTVGTVQAEQKTVYSLVDPNPKATEIFYRIKSVDIDGSVNYSGIVRFKNNSSFSNGGIRVYPSPARNQLTIEHAKLGNKASVHITTIDGRLLKVMVPRIGVSNTMIELGSLTPGIYLLRLDDGKGRIETTTFIKQ